MNKEQSSTINKFDIVEIRIVSCRHQVQILLRWFDLSDQIWYQHLHRNRPDNEKSSRTNCSGSIRVQEICASGISVLIGLIDRWWNWTSLFNQERMNVCECKYSTCGCSVLWHSRAKISLKKKKKILQRAMKLNPQSQELICYFLIYILYITYIPLLLIAIITVRFNSSIKSSFLATLCHHNLSWGLFANPAKLAWFAQHMLPWYGDRECWREVTVVA